MTAWMTMKTDEFVRRIFSKNEYQHKNLYQYEYKGLDLQNFTNPLDEFLKQAKWLAELECLFLLFPMIFGLQQLSKSLVAIVIFLFMVVSIKTQIARFQRLDNNYVKSTRFT